MSPAMWGRRRCSGRPVISGREWLLPGSASWSQAPPCTWTSPSTLPKDPLSLGGRLVCICWAPTRHVCAPRLSSNGVHVTLREQGIPALLWFRPGLKAPRVVESCHFVPFSCVTPFQDLQKGSPFASKLKLAGADSLP